MLFEVIQYFTDFSAPVSFLCWTDYNYVLDIIFVRKVFVDFAQQNYWDAISKNLLSDILFGIAEQVDLHATLWSIIIFP